jgi:hypothetical protein
VLILRYVFMAGCVEVTFMTILNSRNAYFPSVRNFWFGVSCQKGAEIGSAQITPAALLLPLCWVWRASCCAVTLLTCIWEVRASNLRRSVDCFGWEFSCFLSVTQGKFQHSTSNWGRETSFHILSHLRFSHHYRLPFDTKYVSFRHDCQYTGRYLFVINGDCRIGQGAVRVLCATASIPQVQSGSG